MASKPPPYNIFLDFIKEEIAIWTERTPPLLLNAPAWHVSENFIEGPKGKKWFKILQTDKKLLEIYSDENNIKALLNKAFNRYLINLILSEKTGFHLRLAKNLYKRWYKEIYSKEFDYIVLSPLLNFEINKKIKIGDFELYPIKKSGLFLELEGQVYKMLGYNKIKKLKYFGDFPQYYYSFFSRGSAIRLKRKVKKPEDFYSVGRSHFPEYEDFKKDIENFLCILRLFKEGDTRIENYFTSTTSIFQPDFVSYSGGIVYYGGYQYALVDKGEIRRFRYFYKKISKHLKKNTLISNQLKIAIEYFNSSFNKLKVHEKLIDLLIALDALVGTAQETTYRTAIRTASLISKDRSKRITTYNNVLDYLTLRGKLIHGKISPSDNKYTSKIEEAKKFIENQVRLIILLFLSKSGILNKKYIDKLEENLVL